MRHYTKSDPDCNGFKELEPIDQNLRYDFDFQVIHKKILVFGYNIMSLPLANQHHTAESS